MIRTSSSFPGFDVPQQNWFKMPNNWTDITAEISSIAELKVVEYVLRHTWGYQEYGVKRVISIDEFQHGRRNKDGSRMDKGTGLSKQSVITGVKAAVKRGLLQEEIDDRDRARVKKYYLLRMRPKQENGGGVKKLDPDVKNFDTGVKDLDIEGQKFGQRTKKETTERKQQQATSIESNTTTDLDARELAAALVEQGITKPVAQQLAKQYSRQRIQNNLDWFAWKRTNQPATIKSNPAGFLRRAIEQDYASEGHHQGFQTRQQKAEAAAQQKQHLQAQERLIEASKRQQAAELEQKEKARAQRLEKLRERYGTPAALQQQWQGVLKKLKPTISSLKFDLHLVKSELLALTDTQAVISVPTGFSKTWIADMAATTIEDILSASADGQRVALKIIALDHAE